MNYLLRNITIALSAAVCMGCASAQSQDVGAKQITLTFKQMDESFHNFAGLKTGLLKQIDDDMRITYGSFQEATTHSYKRVSAEPDGLRVHTVFADGTLRMFDERVAKKFEGSKNFHNMLALQNEMLELNNTPPDFILNAKGDVVRYEITEDYKQRVLGLMQKTYANIQSRMGGWNQAKPLLSRIKSVIDNPQNISDEDFWPKEDPVWLELSALNGVTLKLDGTPVTGVSYDTDVADGALSYIGRVKCGAIQSSRDCVELKFTREEKNSNLTATHTTYLTVEPDTLKLHSLVSGVNNDLSQPVPELKRSFNYTYRFYTDESAAVERPDLAPAYKTLFNLEVGGEAGLEDFYEVYLPLLKSLKQANSFCNIQETDESSSCRKLFGFYNDSGRMKLVSYIEDLADSQQLSPAQTQTLDELSELMKDRALFLGGRKMQHRSLKSLRTNMNAQKEFASNVIKELESSPVTSQRHQKYVKQALAILEDANGTTWIARFKNLKR